MQVNAKVKDVTTIHTAKGKRLDQPMIEVTLEVNKVGETEKHEIKFSEMLSTIADMTLPEVSEYLEGIVQSYVRTAYKGQQALDPVTSNWDRTALMMGKEFIVEV